MLRIRLRRMGSRHRPFYRVVVSDSHRVPTSSALEEIGHYDPRQKPSVFSIDTERFEHWVGHGARPSETIRRLVKKAQNAPPAPESGGVETAAAGAPAAETKKAEKAVEPEAEQKADETPAAEGAEQKADEAEAGESDAAESEPAEEADGEAKPEES